MGKGLVITSNDLIWYSHSVGEENQLSQIVLWSAHVQFGTFVHMHKHIGKGGGEDGIVDKVLTMQTQGSKFKS